MIASVKLTEIDNDYIELNWSHTFSSGSKNTNYQPKYSSEIKSHVPNNKYLS